MKKAIETIIAISILIFLIGTFTYLATMFNKTKNSQTVTKVAYAIKKDLKQPVVDTIELTNGELSVVNSINIADAPYVSNKAKEIAKSITQPKIKDIVLVEDISKVTIETPLDIKKDTSDVINTMANNKPMYSDYLLSKDTLCANIAIRIRIDSLCVPKVAISSIAMCPDTVFFMIQREHWIWYKPFKKRVRHVSITHSNKERELITISAEETSR